MLVVAAEFPFRVKALYTLNSGRPRELPLVEGKILSIDSCVDDHWFVLFSLAAPLFMSSCQQYLSQV